MFYFSDLLSEDRLYGANRITVAAMETSFLIDQSFVIGESNTFLGANGKTFLTTDALIRYKITRLLLFLSERERTSLNMARITDIEEVTLPFIDLEDL